MFSWRCFPFVDSTPRAYRLKASNAAPLISTSVGRARLRIIAGLSPFSKTKRLYVVDRTHDVVVVTRDVRHFLESNLVTLPPGAFTSKKNASPVLIKSRIGTGDS
jgi:hypothetical protein